MSHHLITHRLTPDLRAERQRYSHRGRAFQQRLGFRSLSTEYDSKDVRGCVHETLQRFVAIASLNNIVHVLDVLSASVLGAYLQFVSLMHVVASDTPNFVRHRCGEQPSMLVLWSILQNRVGSHHGNPC